MNKYLMDQVQNEKSGVYSLDTKTNLVIHDKSGRFCTLQEYQTIPTNVILNKDSDIILQW